MIIQQNSIATSKALNLLFHSETYPGMRKLANDAVTLILSRNETLGDYITYTLFELKESYFVRRVIWKQRFEFKQKEPQTFGADVVISKTTFDTIILKISKVQFDHIELKNQSICIDGIVCGIIFKNNKITWYENESAANASNIPIIYCDLLSIFDSLFD